MVVDALPWNRPLFYTRPKASPGAFSKRVPLVGPAINTAHLLGFGFLVSARLLIHRVAETRVNLARDRFVMTELGYAWRDTDASRCPT
jgi:hypothetical protein